MKILISGSRGSLAKELYKQAAILGHHIFNAPRNVMDVYEYDSIIHVLKVFDPDIFIHCGAFTRPMSKHITNSEESINSNIIGTCNVVKACMLNNTKLIYISTNYVYPGTKGNYSEEDPLLPINEYAWSKLGGECAVQMYKNSLIIRLCKIDKPYPHEYAIENAYNSLLPTEDAAASILKVLNESGVLNIGGERQTFLEYALKENSEILPIKIEDIKDVKIGKDSSINISKYENTCSNI